MQTTSIYQQYRSLSYAATVAAVLRDTEGQSALDRALAVERAVFPSSRKSRAYYLSRNGGSKREYSCSICDARIDSECARYRMTRHAERAIEAHSEGPCHEQYLVAAVIGAFARWASS